MSDLALSIAQHPTRMLRSGASGAAVSCVALPRGAPAVLVVRARTTHPTMRTHPREGDACRTLKATLKDRPPSDTPSIFSTACFASSTLRISTRARPRGRPVAS